MSHQDVANSEKSATSPWSGATSSSAPTRKIRSCFVCRQRKVRCDKQSPCGNCRRAKIPCVLPSADRPPRWARRRELLANNAVAASRTVAPGDGDLVERVRYLENLVTELSNQLQQARTTAGSSGASSWGPSPASTSQRYGEQHEPVAEVDNMRSQFGHMVVQDSGRTHYVSSGFWSRINDELDGLDIHTDGSPSDESNSSEEETCPNDSTFAKGRDLKTHQYAFLFRRPSASSTPDLRDFHPLPSQVPFLLEVFSENVYPLLCIVHLPSIKNTVRDMRGSGATAPSLSDEALLYSIYYAAIVSLEEDDVITNFGESKSVLILRYRDGLEDALSRADFLNSPDLTLLQALALFVFLARRHDSPRYIWFMTAVVIRMAHYLGLHRDGAYFNHLTPYEVEIRRRVWWVVVLLDVRASEDQGTEITIKRSGFDTKLPLNVNDADIDPSTKNAPTPTTRFGVTDVSFLRAAGSSADITIQVMAAKTGGDLASCTEQARLLNEISTDYDREYLQHVPDTGSILFWVVKTAARVVQGKLTLLVYLPVLLSSPSEKGSEEIRDKLLISAIEVAEGNHVLNEHARQWRWIWQVQTHWYAFVYLLIETSRRPWSAIVERAWIALQSEWLFPQRRPTDKDMRIWVPLRKLMHRAKKHRNAEIRRLRTDPDAAVKLEVQDKQFSWPSKPGLSPSESSHEIYLQRWRDLVTPREHQETSPSLDAALAVPSTEPIDKIQEAVIMNEPLRPGFPGPASVHAENTDITGEAVRMTIGSYSGVETEQAAKPTDYAYSRNTWPDFGNWLWADIDHDPSLDMFTNMDMSLDLLVPSIDLEGGMDWNDWIESAKASQ